jgi:hypothetical protein
MSEKHPQRVWVVFHQIGNYVRPLSVWRTALEAQYEIPHVRKLYKGWGGEVGFGPYTASVKGRTYTFPCGVRPWAKHELSGDKDDV